jgi:uncharacterized protein (TIGR00369 family)
MADQGLAPAPGSEGDNVMAHPTHPEAVPEGFVPATHGGPYAKELGPFWSKPEESQVTLGLRLQHRHCNSAGAAHGGFVATLADLGLIHAVSVMREREGRPRHHLTTVTLTVDYVAPAKEGCWLEVRAEVSRLGRNLCFTEGVMLADGKRVARVSAVMAVLGPRT